MTPFGKLYGEKIEKIRFVMMVGSSGGIYCYDSGEDAVFQLGDSLSSFCDDGLRRLDSIYNTAYVPPKILVDGIIASLAEAESVTTFSAIVAANQGALYDVSDTLAGIDSQLMLYKGDYGTVSSCSLGTSINMTMLMCAVVRRMSCTFDIFAVIGYKAGLTMFRPRLIVMMDPFGAIYGYDNCLNKISRLADNFMMFLRIVTQKSLFNFRHDRGLRGVSRLEKAPYCPHVGNVTEIVMDPDADINVEPQYITRDPSESFTLTKLCSFGEPIGHRTFMGRKNRFFDVDRINKNQSMDGFVTDIFCHYDAAYTMKAAYYGFKHITDRLWPEEIEGLLLGHPSCLPMAYDVVVKAAFDRMRFIRSMDDDPDESDSDTVSTAINDPPCRRCVERRRARIFKRVRGLESK